jgi:hypothetical protein
VIRATALTAGWICGAAVAAARSSRINARPLGSALSPHAAVLLLGTAGAFVVPWAPAMAVGLALNGFATTRLVLALKSRLVARHPGRVGAAFAVVSTIEFAGFVLPVLAGRIADAYGVRAGLACFVVIAAVLVLVTGTGDQIGARRAQASRARAI